MADCPVDECTKPVRRYDRYCRMHEARLARHGSTDVVLVVHGHLRERMEALIVRDANGCWLWQGTTNGRGYASVRVDRTRPTARAHRVMYELEVGPIPDGMELDHLCNVRHCIAPHHLEPVTHAENMRRGVARRRK